jgi:predicted transposase YbfD/YdcC
MKKSIIDIFSQIKDHRRDITKRHELIDIIVIGVLAVICGAETWNNMEEYGRSKEIFLRQFLRLSNGIPSHDTFNRVFCSINPVEFEKYFIQWVNSLSVQPKGQVISVDGKTIRGAKSGGNKSPFHLVSAWAEENNLVLGQVRTAEKSNEITAIPQLLELIDIDQNIVTIDAMGCQQNIATTIINKGGNYILAVKQNQEHLLDDIVHVFKHSKKITNHTSTDIGHGRIETRTCSICNDLEEIDNLDKWNQIKTIVRVESKREFKNSDKPEENSVRYYISSLNSSAIEFGKAIRSHWSIENKLHWTLDVAFGEDASRKRAGAAPQCFSILNKIALNLLKNEKTVKCGVKGRRLKAAWDDEYLLKVLNL